MNKPVNLLTPAQILDSLKALKLEGMAELFPDVATNPQFQNLTFEELFGILVEHECTVQRVKRATRCLKRSGLQELEVFNQADLDKAIFAKERNLQESQVRKLLTCNWITEPPAYSLLVTGATGTGKTWLLALLGKAACQKGISTLYLRFSRLMELMEDAKLHNQMAQYRQRVNRHKLLIIDDFGLEPMSSGMSSSLLALLDERVGHSSTIVAGQMAVKEWHGYLGAKHSADAILDRLINGNFMLELEGPSMRERSPRRKL